ncbi:MAG: ABC transporter substrate-binding protein [Reyranella sp.]|nr:ABC transporter substrate-binding protein [Reyranella sp.]
MKRRNILAVTLGAPFVVTARHAVAAERLIGWISPESTQTTAPFLAAFRAGLTGALPSSGEPVKILERYNANTPTLAAAMVAELQQAGVRLIVAQGAAAVTVVAAKPTVPVVFGFSGDPVVAGIAQSLSRPGGNATGVSFMSLELNPKRIDLMRIALPNCRKIGLLSNTRHAGEEKEIAACQGAVQPLGIELAVYRAQTAGEVRPALTQALDDGAQAVVMLPSSSMVQQGPVAAADCIARKVPLVSGWAVIARAGALLTYGPNLQEAYRRVALCAVRVLGGAAPATLPIEQPTVFELVINQKTAAALGLTLPPALLAQADEIIE